MKKTPATADNAHSDQGKAHTPDRHRTESARWKDHDQPDEPRDGRPDPEQDYPDARVGSPGRHRG
ncbi:hypothetical protein [Pseudoxanthomonas sp. 10H]|uniref:hypothetical protein n=1 Tax=Pseudoxanthomonas sp. 10H TaxID=3242729 RepID=UPI003555E5DE